MTNIAYPLVFGAGQVPRIPTASQEEEGDPAVDGFLAAFQVAPDVIPTVSAPAARAMSADETKPAPLAADQDEIPAETGVVAGQDRMASLPMAPKNGNPPVHTGMDEHASRILPGMMALSVGSSPVRAGILNTVPRIAAPLSEFPETVLMPQTGNKPTETTIMWTSPPFPEVMSPMISGAFPVELPPFGPEASFAGST
ncbi:MAG: hypothetical protein ACK5M4_10610, partial [Pseudorhodobacter sp.]